MECIYVCMYVWYVVVISVHTTCHRVSTLARAAFQELQFIPQIIVWMSVAWWSNRSWPVRAHTWSVCESVFLVLFMRGVQGSELRKVSSKSHIITFRSDIPAVLYIIIKYKQNIVKHNSCDLCLTIFYLYFLN